MKKIILLSIACIVGVLSFAQKSSFDIISYTAPKGWKKEVKENVTIFTITDKKTSSWCQISIVKSTISKGDIEKDFDSEWQELVVKSFKVTDAPEGNEVAEAEGWKIKTGGGKFTFNNSNAMVLLTTLSGYNRCVSIVSTTGSQRYIKDIEDLLASLDLKKPDTTTTAQTQNNISDSKSIIGDWKATASDQSSFRVKNGVMNYISRQYTFNSNGTYSFVSKAFDPLMEKNYTR